MKWITDVHNHSEYSHDCQIPLVEVLENAQKNGIAFYGVSEHFDYDVTIVKGDLSQSIDAEAYFHGARHLQEDYAGVLNFLVGAELSYCDDARVIEANKEVCEKYAPDFVVNSVHCSPRGDYYTKTPFYQADGRVRDKDEVYEEYFALIRRSVDADYEYDILAHVNYCARYAPYEDNEARWKDYSTAIDGILKALIARDKILEVNTSNKGCVGWMIPNTDILERYFELGGRKISFASDAHNRSRIGENRDKVVDSLRAIGFDSITVPVRKKHVQIEI